MFIYGAFIEKFRGWAEGGADGKSDREFLEIGSRAMAHDLLKGQFALEIEQYFKSENIDDFQKQLMNDLVDVAFWED